MALGTLRNQQGKNVYGFYGSKNTNNIEIYILQVYFSNP